VAIFDESGNLLQTLINGALASPWGIALAPASFGPLGGDLLVGNFSYADSEINAFAPGTGAFEGTILINTGSASSGGLWDIGFGPGAATEIPTPSTSPMASMARRAGCLCHNICTRGAILVDALCRTCHARWLGRHAPPQKDNLKTIVLRRLENGGHRCPFRKPYLIPTCVVDHA